jgi:hypothetical protein
MLSPNMPTTDTALVSNDAIETQSAYGLVHLRARFGPANRRWEVTAFVGNVATRSTPSAPRTSRCPRLQCIRARRAVGDPVHAPSLTRPARVELVAT